MIVRKGSDQMNYRFSWRVLLTLVLLVGATRSVALAADSHPAQMSFVELDTLVLPAVGRVTGLTWMGPDTLAVLMDIADTLTSSGEAEMHLVFLDTAGVVFRDDDFTGVLNRGLTWNGEFLWSCGDADDGSAILYKIATDSLGVWQIEDAYDTPGHRPSDLCFDGRFVWITDRDSGRVDRFDPEVSEITRSALTPGFSPVGVGWDGRNMWLTDAGTGLMYRLSGSRRTWSATIDAGVFMHRGEEILLTSEGSDFWFVLGKQNAAVRIRFY